MISYFVELFNPSTIKGSVLCSIAAAIILSGFIFVFRKLFKNTKGDDFIMKANEKKGEIQTEKEVRASTKENKHLKKRDVNNFDEIKIKGDISGTVNIGSGNIKINNKK